MPKIKTTMNAKAFPKTYQPSGGKSMTVPDQTLSIKQILDRFARNLPLGGNNTGTYSLTDDDEPDDMDFVDLKRLDLSEIESLKRGNEAEIARLRSDLDKTQAATQKASYEAKINAEVEKRLAAISKTPA